MINMLQLLRRAPETGIAIDSQARWLSTRAGTTRMARNQDSVETTSGEQVTGSGKKPKSYLRPIQFCMQRDNDDEERAYIEVKIGRLAAEARTPPCPPDVGRSVLASRQSMITNVRKT